LNGPASIEVCGAVVSTTHVRVSGVWSALPSESVALTEKVCSPSDNELYVRGEEQLVKLPVSSLHSNVAFESSEENANVAELEVLGSDGPESIVV